MKSKEPIEQVSVDDDVPIKPIRMEGKPGRKYRFPFFEMKVGQSFFIPRVTKKWARCYVIYANTHGTSKFVLGWDYCRKVDGRWKQCDKKDEGATLGVRVKRVK